MIRFPHLGIELSHVGRFFSVFGLEVAYYGVILALAMIAGVYIAMWAAKKTGQDPELYFNFAIIAIILSVIGARVYYVVFSWDYYGSHPGEIFNLRAGGLAIYGGVLAGITTAFFYALLKKIRPLLMMDTACIGLITGQMIGRWGNFFNREAFGEYTDSLFAMQLPAGAVNSADITAKMTEEMRYINDVPFIQVHPTFLYESLWNLGVLLILLAVTLTKKKRFDGQVFFLYLLGYGTGRFWMEGLRSDQLLIPGTQFAVSQILSAVLAAAALAALAAGMYRSGKSKTHR